MREARSLTRPFLRLEFDIAGLESWTDVHGQVEVENCIAAILHCMGKQGHLILRTNDGLAAERPYKAVIAPCSKPDESKDALVTLIYPDGHTHCLHWSYESRTLITRADFSTPAVVDPYQPYADLTALIDDDPGTRSRLGREYERRRYDEALDKLATALRAEIAGIEEAGAEHKQLGRLPALANATATADGLGLALESLDDMRCALKVAISD